MRLDEFWSDGLGALLTREEKCGLWRDKYESQSGVRPTHLVCREGVPNLVPFWRMVILVNEFFYHSPSNARAVQPEILSSSFEVHDLKFAGGVTVGLCGDRKR